VIVIDAVQFAIILLGLLFIIGTILVRVHAPLGAVLADLAANHRLQLFDFSPSLVKPWTFWAVVIGQTTACMGQYMSDQMALQRYLAAESPAAVNRSFLINVWGSVVSTLFLVTVGLLLFVWYLHHPDPALPLNPDMVLPFFAVRQLPAGLSGLLVAAFLAATMNTLTSGINSLAGAITNDFISRLGRKRAPEDLFRWGRGLSVAIGLLATFSAGFAKHLGTMLTASNIVMGAVLGPMLGCMVWAASSAAVRPAAVIWGMILGALASIGVSMVVSSFWVALAGFLVSILVPWLDSVFAGRPGVGTGSPAPAERT
jgi:Na+/proline symporter